MRETGRKTHQQGQVAAFYQTLEVTTLLVSNYKAANYRKPRDALTAINLIAFFILYYLQTIIFLIPRYTVKSPPL